MERELSTVTSLYTHRFPPHVRSRVYTLSTPSYPRQGLEEGLLLSTPVYGCEQPSFVCARLSGLCQNSIKNIYINLPVLLNNTSQYPLHECSLVFSEHKGFSPSYSDLKY